MLQHAVHGRRQLAGQRLLKPVWIETFAVARRAGGPEIHYVILNDLPSLIWSANLANLEIHPFLARAPDIERPDFIVFDLDPGEGANILACGDVAFLLKNSLARVGLDSFAKVSGSKGIQVYVPVRTSATYAETRPLARSIAESVEREHPDIVVSKMTKAARPHKVLIDWSQNWDFKTTIAVYSLRAKRDTPYVSMPIDWNELRRAMRKCTPASLYFEPEAALRRLDKTGDLFAPLVRTRQKLPGRTAAGAPRANSQ